MTEAASYRSRRGHSVIQDANLAPVPLRYPVVNTQIQPDVALADGWVAHTRTVSGHKDRGFPYLVPESKIRINEMAWPHRKVPCFNSGLANVTVEEPALLFSVRFSCSGLFHTLILAKRFTRSLSC